MRAPFLSIGFSRFKTTAEHRLAVRQQINTNALHLNSHAVGIIICRRCRAESAHLIRRKHGRAQYAHQLGVAHTPHLIIIGNRQPKNRNVFTHAHEYTPFYPFVKHGSSGGVQFVRRSKNRHTKSAKQQAPDSILSGKESRKHEPSDGKKRRNHEETSVNPN